MTQSILDIAFSGKTVLLRADFNVPMDERQNITDDIRVRMVLPTIKHILKEQGKLVICSHLGRPKGQRVEDLSLAPVAQRLASLLEVPVHLAADCVGPETEAFVRGTAAAEIVLLENLRFHKGETENDPEFSAQLGRLGDIYINDAFAVSHRAHASVAGVAAHFTEKAAGFLLRTELEYFHKAVDDPARPLVAIVGGAKVSSKLGALVNMLDRVDKMIIGGAMANTFLKGMGFALGASKTEDDLLEDARGLLAAAKEKGVAIYLPVDFVVADAFSPDAVTKIVTVSDVPAEWMALDIGPASSLYFREALEGAKTIVWNGPVGAFEMDAYARGTMALCQAIASSHALTIVGGGDSNAAVKKAGEERNISYMSTGGGAFLRLLEGKDLPGVTALA